MKIECSKQNLLNGVTTVSKAVPSKTTMSILQCILIKAEKGIITLTANDMDLGIETSIEGTIIEEGIIALDAKFLFEIVRKLPDSDVVINVESNFTTNIVCENVKFNLIGKDGSEFPGLPVIDRIDNVLISDLALKDMIRQTIFCVGNNASNPIMNSEYFHINGDILEMVALDGHRIAQRKISLKNTYNEISAIIPAKTLNEIERILTGDSNKDVVLYFTNSHIMFEMDQTIVVSRLVEGSYFDYQRMLNNDYETKINVSKKDIFAPIDRGTILLREGEKKPIIFEVRDTNINFFISTLVGKMDENVSVEKTGKDIDIAFNPQFFLETLKAIEDENITIYMMSAKNPCLIKNDEESYVYLILPVNFVR